MIPADLRYTKEHEWARLESGGAITIGITHHAQEQLGDVVYAELPKVGDELMAGDTFGVVESVKSVSDLYAPVDGTVSAINEHLLDAAEMINAEPYGQGWLIKVRAMDITQFRGLMDAAAYEKFLAAETH